MRHLLNNWHYAATSLCYAMCLEWECEISSEIYLLHSSKCVGRGIMDTVYAIPSWQLEKRVVSSRIWFMDKGKSSSFIKIKIKSFRVPARCVVTIAKIIGIHFHFRGKENIVKDSGCIVLINHQSSLDLCGNSNYWNYYEFIKLKSALNKFIKIIMSE